MCCFMLSLSGIVHAASIEFKPCIKWLREVKKIKNYKAVSPKKLSRSLTGGGRLREVPTVQLRLGNVWCFG